MARGHREVRQQDAPELQLLLDALGDDQAAVASAGELIVGEERPHVAGRLHPVALAVEAEALLVADQCPRLDAEEDIVVCRLLAPGVMAVVGSQERRPDLPGDGQQVGQHPLLSGHPMVHDLDEEVLLPEDLLVHAGGGHRRPEVTGHPDVPLLVVGVGGEQLGNVAPEAAGGADEPGGVLGEQLDVHPGLVVEALQERPAGQLDQVAVPGVVDRQQRDVVAQFLPAGRPVEPGARGQVALHADDRLHPGGGGRFVEVHGPVERPVVGDGDRRLSVGGHRCHHLLDPGGPVEHRVLGMEMEVSEARLVHADPRTTDV